MASITVTDPDRVRVGIDTASSGEKRIDLTLNLERASMSLECARRLYELLGMLRHTWQIEPDLYTRAVAKVLGIRIEDVTTPQRNVAKHVAFDAAYRALLDSDQLFEKVCEQLRKHESRLRAEGR